MALCELRYYSKALGKQTGAQVILPESGEGPYPVLYLLHGLSDDYTAWGRRSSIERHLDGLPLIVVMPDGGRSFYLDAVHGPAYGTALAIELPERIERTFPARTDRDGRFVAGLSMGGFGAMRFALGYPERFGAASSHSGAVGFGHFIERWRDDPRLEEFRLILGDDPVGGPNDLFTLAEQCAHASDIPRLRLDCGAEDFLLEDNRAFHDHLTALGITHTYDEYPGAHEWGYWDLHIQDTLRFLMPS